MVELDTPADEVLGIKWHEYSDEDIHTAVTSLSQSNSQSISSANPYHDALRALSAAVHRLSKARAELEDDRRTLLEREAARRSRASELMKELQPSEHDVARRIIQSLFPDDDEDSHEVRRKHSTNVSFSTQVHSIFSRLSSSHYQSLLLRLLKMSCLCPEASRSHSPYTGTANRPNQHPSSSHRSRRFRTSFRLLNAPRLSTLPFRLSYNPRTPTLMTHSAPPKANARRLVIGLERGG